MIFTASTKDYADLIINVIDPHQDYIKHRFYREHTSVINMEVVKDLNKVKRDLKRVILIDNLASNLKLQPYNGFHIKTWTDDIADKELLYLSRILKDFVVNKVDDVRKEIKKIKDELQITNQYGLNSKPGNGNDPLFSGNNLHEPSYLDHYLLLRNEDGRLE